MNVSTSGGQLAPPPKGTAEGEFFYREENLFHDLDLKKEPTVTEAEEELETNVHVIQATQANRRMCNSKL